MLPTVELFDHVGLGLIIEYPTGVAYSNQTGGTSCLAPRVEGVFVPIGNESSLGIAELISPENDLYEYFEGPRWRGTGATSGIDTEDADFIEKVLGNFGLSQTVAVDRSRLRESHEAWVHVQVLSEQDSVFRGFAPYPRPGVLTWSNTD